MKTIYDSLLESYTDENWKLVATKRVEDSDGSMTDYSWYTNGEIHIFMFGDPEVNEPDEDYADWSAETEEEAQEWFDNYVGFADVDDDDDDYMDECAFRSPEDLMNKGLDRKYGIESNVVTESYNNLPDWITSFLDSHMSGNTVKNSLTLSGVDLHNATYVRGPIPQSARDPQIKDSTKLRIFRVTDFEGNEHIYIPGHTNPRIRVTAWDWKYCDDLAKRDLLARTTEFGYIDLNDDRNSNKDVRLDRAVIRNSNPNDRHPERGQRFVDRAGKWITDRGYDKSGYKLDPEKYERMLNDVGLDSYAERLDKMYQDIEAVRATIIEIMNSYTAETGAKLRTPGWGNNVFHTIGDAVDALSRAIDEFNSAKVQIEKAINSGDSKFDGLYPVDEQIRDIFRYNGQACRGYLKDARKEIESIRAAKPVDEAVALSTIDGTVSSALLGKTAQFKEVTTKPELEATVDDAFGGLEFENIKESQRPYAQKVIDNIKHMNFTKALLYVYDIIMRGDGLGVNGTKPSKRR